MKRCEECHTHYEDHITVCLVDGNELVVVPEEVEESEPPRKGFLWLGIAGLTLAVLASAFAVYTVMSRPEPVPAPPPVEVAVPVPVPAPEPVAKPERLAMTSQPSGAKVYEGETLLCVTPCDVEPNEASRREFRFELEGYEPSVYALEEQTGRHQVALQAVVAAPAPVPSPRRRPPPRRTRPSEPAPAPEPVVPAPVPEPVPEPVAAPTPKPPAPAPAPEPVAPEPEITTISDFKDPFE